MDQNVATVIVAGSSAAVAVITVIVSYYAAGRQSKAMIEAAERTAKATVEATRIEAKEARTHQIEHLNATRRKEAIERQEQRRQERITRLDALMSALREKRGKLQYWQNKGEDSVDPDTLTREILYGDAYSIMLSVGDQTIKELAEKVIHPETPFPYKVAAISDGLARIAEMIYDLYQLPLE